MLGMKNKIKIFINNLFSKNFGKLHNEAVKNLGGIEYATMEYRQRLLAEINRIIKENKRYRIVLYLSILSMIMGIISMLITIIV